MQTEQIYDIALTRADGIGSVLFRQLINRFGSASGVFSSGKEKLMKVPGFGRTLADNILQSDLNLREAESIWYKSKQQGVNIVSFKDERYPQRLRSFYDAPPVLYMKGEHDLNRPRTVGIVGTRQASEYGKSATEMIVEALKPYDVQIISGLAYGIDIAAHKAALRQQLSTVAVLANGLDITYPSTHKKSATEIASHGVLVSENPVGTLPVAPLFLARNRIIAALSDVLIVVESAQKGGAMVTAEIANNYNKEVYAVPGSIFHKFAEGTNSLIQSNKARIYLDAAELAENLGWQAGRANVRVPAEIPLDLSRFTEEESTVVSILMKKPDCIIDDLSWQSQIPLNRLASVLLNLEFMDVVKQSAGKTFRLK